MEKQGGDYEMPINRNGRFRVDSISPVQINVTGAKLALGLWTAVLVLLQAGWVIVPAKDSDLKNVQEQLVGLREDVQALSLDLRGLRADTQRNREELIRLGVPPNMLPTASVVQPARRSKPKLRSSTEASAETRGMGGTR